MELEKELQRLYRYAIHVIYAAVIAVSFDIAKDVVVPFENIWNYPVNVSLLVLSYFIIVTSWIGYFISIITSPHEGTIGRLRFGLDIFIIFIFYYMVSLTTPDNSKFIPDVFLFVLPILYFTYWVWDSLKILEYRSRDSPEKRVDRLDARNITLYFLTMFLSLAAGYLIWLYITSFAYSGLVAHIRDCVFIAASFGLTFLYRVAKWRHMTRHNESLD